MIVGKCCFTRGALFAAGMMLLLLSGCSQYGKTSGWPLETSSGITSWDTTGTLAAFAETYLDGGERKKAHLLDASHSSKLRLVSPKVAVDSGQTVSFRFAFKCRHAMGELFQARLRMFDDNGSLKVDSSLYRIRARVEDDDPGRTGDWICYTRCLKVPEGVTAVEAEVVSTPERGKVWLGETALVDGEDWMAYAATFSTHLKKHPEDKCVYTVGRHVEPYQLPRPAEEERRSGLMFFERKGLVGAWPYANPHSTDRVEAMVEKTPGLATASFAFGVKALEDLSQVEVSITRPLATSERAFPAEPVLSQGRYVAARLGSSWGKEFGISTKLLTVIEPKPILSGQNSFYWIDVPVPEQTTPGLYEGELSVQAADHPALKIPFRLEVQPVVLPPSHDYTIGMYYYPPDDPGLMKIHLKDMAAHGVYAISLAGAFVEKDGRGGVRLNPGKVEKLDTLMGLMRKHGFFKPTALFVQDLMRILELPEEADQWTEAHKNLYRRAIRLMNDTAESRSWCPLMFFPVDEPANRPELMKIAHLVLGILRKMPGVIPYCDLNSPESVLELSDYIDVICMQILSVSPLTVQAMKAKQVQTFFYLPGFGWNTGFHRGIPGWFLPRSGAQGIYYFAYQHVTGDPYDELDGRNRDWSTAYPAPEPYFIWPCPEWQGIRRGIEDLRLLALANKLIDTCSAHSDEKVRSLGRSVSTKIDSIYQNVEATGPGASYQLYHDIKPDMFEHWRQEILERVISMQQALE